MSVYFLTGYFENVDSYSLNDFLSMDLGTVISNLPFAGETVNGDSHFNNAVFESQVEEEGS